MDPHQMDLEDPEDLDPVDPHLTDGVEILDLLAVVDHQWVWVDLHHIGVDLEAGTHRLVWKMDLQRTPQKWRKRTLKTALKRPLRNSTLT